jgi:hypothetical protein
MKTTNKQHPVYQYMIDAIDGEGYDKTLTTTEEKLQFVLDTFRNEYGWMIKRDGEYKAFTEWISGLPSSFNIDFENYRILELAHKWESLPDNATESQEYKITSNWFKFITVKFFQLCKRNNVR